MDPSDPVIVITSTIAVFQSISSIYEAIQHFGGLPNVLHKVGMNLSLAEDILRLARQQLQGLALDESSTDALQPVVNICEERAETLLSIFKEFEKEVNNANDGSMLDFYRTSLLRVGRPPRVETLMQDILRGLEILATGHLANTASLSQMAELQKVIDRLPNWELFMPNSDFNGPETNSQNIAYAGTGYQSNIASQDQIINSGMGESYHGHTRRDILRALYTSPYRDRKNWNPDRVPGTCEWFVGHRDFQRWRESKTSSMLWVSANPGCGKSVLAKYLVDSELKTTESRTTCYFFFRDDFEDQRSAKSALSCILHQLFLQRRDLFSDEIVQRLGAYTAGLDSSIDKLWEVLIIASQHAYSGELVLILDAFDECKDRERLKLARALRKFYDMENDTKDNANLKFLVTSRPDDTIRRGFEPLNIPGLPVIHLEGESDAETSKIASEIDVYIEDRVSRIRENLRLEPAEEELLLQQLRRVPNQTYLWVYLTLELIESDININKTKILEATSSLPRTVAHAYERILSRSRDFEEAKRLLHIIVAAARPLTLAEVELALALQKDYRSYKDIKVMPEGRFRVYITQLCGLFVTVKDSKIYLIHQTAKEFLVRKDWKDNPYLRGNHRDRHSWKSSLRPSESHHILYQSCIQHLSFTEFETSPLRRNMDVSRYLRHHVFLEYSATNWAAHFQASNVKEGAALDTLLRICNPSSRRFQTWFRIYCASAQMDFPQGFTSLMIASHFGLEQIVKLQLARNDVKVDAVDGTYGRSALSWASENGFDGIVKLLIRGPDPRSETKQFFPIPAEVNTRDKYGLTPLSYAVLNGHMAVVERLVKAGARVDSKDEIGGTPASYALCCGHEALASQLMKGAQIDSVDTIRQKLLLSAAEKGHKGIVERLLENGAAVGLVDSNGRTALSWAAGGDHEAIVRLLVDRGAIVETRDNTGRTPLSYAAEGGHMAVTRLLLDSGDTTNVVDSTGRTPLSWAARDGHEAIVKLLVDRGAIIQATDSIGAAEKGHKAIAQLLVATKKVDVRSANIHESELLVRDNAIEPPPGVGKHDNIYFHSVELDHHSQGSLLDPGSSFTGNSTEMISKPDSGYASLESWGHSAKHGSDSASLYSVGSNIPQGLQDTYVDEFSRQLSDELRKLLMVEELPEGLYGVLLPELLKSFSRRLHGESTKRAQREASVFVHRHRRDIAISFAQTFPGEPRSQSSDNDILEEETGTSESRATEIEGSPDDYDYEKTLPPREPFKKDPHDVKHWVSSLDSRISSEPSNAVGDVESPNQSRDSLLPQIGDYRSFIETSRAYQWLLSSLEKRLKLDMPDRNLMYEIGASIRSKLLEDETMRKLSRRQAQPLVQMTFNFEWDLRKFVMHQEYVNSGPTILNHILCVTGSRQRAQATTVHQYFEQTWPGLNHPLISLLNKFLSSTQFASCDLELSDGSSLAITQDRSHCRIAVRGGFEFVVEIGEQLGWLGSALRPSELTSGVVDCVPTILSVNIHGQSAHKGNIIINATCRITFRMNRRDSLEPLLSGFCWANMFQNPVIVAGYPIRHRDQGDTGLEIPLEVMAELVQSNQVFNIDGKIMLKGFSSLLVVTAIDADAVIWHFLFNADDERISYCDIRLEGPEGLRIVTPKGLELRHLETRRHVVGWCSHVREFTGHPQAGFGIKRSILPLTSTSFVIDKLYVQSGFGLIGGISVSPGKRDKPLRLARGRSFSGMLAWIYSQSLVLMDVDDRRAWLVDGASGLLHLVRASIEQDRNHPAYKSKWKVPGALNLEGDDFLGLAGDRGMTAVEILGNPVNLNVQLYVDDVEPNASGELVEISYRLRNKVQEVLPLLEAIVDKQAEVAAQDGYWMHPTSTRLEKSLAGWDFWDIAGPSGPVQRRIYHLQASGRGWVDYIRSIKAVTIFGKGFGELLEPEGRNICPNWTTVPKSKDYLGSSIATLKNIHASNNIQPLDPGLITADITWSSQATLFSPCACLDSNGETPTHHHDPVQLLLPKGRNLHLDIPSTSLSVTIGSIECNGAVVFGHTPYRWSWSKNKKTDDQVDSESTEPPPSASNSSQPKVSPSDDSRLIEMSSSSSRAHITSASGPAMLEDPAKNKGKKRWSISWIKKLSR